MSAPDRIPLSVQRPSDGELRFRAFLLLFPSITGATILVVSLTKARHWLLDWLPYQLGSIALQNAFVGWLVMTVTLSAWWNYLRLRRKVSGGNLAFRVFCWAFAMPLMHALVGLTLAFPGCIFMGAFD